MGKPQSQKQRKAAMRAEFQAAQAAEEERAELEKKNREWEIRIGRLMDKKQELSAEVHRIAKTPIPDDMLKFGPALERVMKFRDELNTTFDEYRKFLDMTVEDVETLTNTAGGYHECIARVYALLDTIAANRRYWIRNFAEHFDSDFINALSEEQRMGILDYWEPELKTWAGELMDDLAAANAIVTEMTPDNVLKFAPLVNKIAQTLHVYEPVAIAYNQVWRISAANDNRTDVGCMKHKLHELPKNVDMNMAKLTLEFMNKGESMLRRLPWKDGEVLRTTLHSYNAEMSSASMQHMTKMSDFTMEFNRYYGQRKRIERAVGGRD